MLVTACGLDRFGARCQIHDAGTPRVSTLIDGHELECGSLDDTCDDRGNLDVSLDRVTIEAAG